MAKQVSESAKNDNREQKLPLADKVDQLCDRTAVIT